MGALGALAFRGRTRECEVLDGSLDRVRAGESAVLVIRGEAGIGKTALLSYCAGRASDCTVVQIAGVKAELAMPFAALHQLCRPMMDGLISLPEPQERALQVAFGFATGSAPDPFLVGLAVLSVLTEVAAERPLVCLVDDAQWLDETSSQVLGFVGRRLLADAVMLVFAVREEAGDERLFPALPALAVQGLADEDARALLTHTVPYRLNEQIRDRIVAETRGNPLGLLELPRGMSRAELAGGFGVPTTATLSSQIEDRYLQRVRALPRPAQQLILLAAADPLGDAALIWRAAHALGIGQDAAAVAESEQLLDLGLRARFRHPLVRSAAYAAATPEDRSAAHMALAGATDPQHDPERRAWHLAAATSDPDEEVASELERTAGRAEARAGRAAAAAFLQRSFELTADPARRAERAFAAAQAHLLAGAFDEARSLLAKARALAVDDLQRARVEQLTGQTEAAANPGQEAPVRLLQAAARLEPLDVSLARETYLQAWWAAILAGFAAPPGGDLLEVSEAALAAPPASDPRPCDLLLDGMATLVTEGRAAAAPGLRRAIDLYRTGRVSADDWIRWGRSATMASFALWDVDSWLELSARQVELARASGALTTLVLSLNLHAFGRTYCGDLEGATSVVAEQNAAQEATGIRMASYGAPMLAAYQGRSGSLSPQMAAIEDGLVQSDVGYVAEVANLATAVLHNSFGRYAEATAAAQELLTYRFAFLAPFALSELVEAAARSADAQVADDAARRFSAFTVAGSDWAAGLEARCQALVSAGHAAEHWYNDSIACLARTPLRPELARTHLLYGEWLRGEHRQLDAREQLRTAHDMFAMMGANAFTERARQELVATGETVAKRAVATPHELTPQEEHIARLARDGRSNAEIGAELFISARTVEWHLQKVFRKLGISARKALRDALPTPAR